MSAYVIRGNTQDACGWVGEWEGEGVWVDLNLLLYLDIESKCFNCKQRLLTLRN